MTTGAAEPTVSPVGRLLKHWRGIRRMSQLDLSLAANVSSRHVSFVESGRSRPSREMVLQLARSLDVPLREQNALLTAAGYADAFRESTLEEPEMLQVRQALTFILKAHEPYPALVLDRHWNMISANQATGRVLAAFLDPTALAQGGPVNVMRLTFHPDGLRSCIVNWEEVAAALMTRMHREALGGVPDEETARLIDELLSYPGVPQTWAVPDLETPLAPLIGLHLKKEGLELHFFRGLPGIVWK